MLGVIYKYIYRQSCLSLSLYIYGDVQKPLVQTSHQKSYVRRDVCAAFFSRFEGTFGSNPAATNPIKSDGKHNTKYDVCAGRFGPAPALQQLFGSFGTCAGACAGAVQEARSLRATTP